MLSLKSQLPEWLAFRSNVGRKQQCFTPLQTQPPAQPLFAVAWLALSSGGNLSWSCEGALRVLRFALPCYMPRYVAKCLRMSSWRCGGALFILHFATPRYTPRHTAVTCLVARPTPAQLAIPFCHRLACVEQLQTSSRSCGGGIGVLHLN